MNVLHIPEHVVPGKRLGRHVEHDPQSRSYAITAVARGLKSTSWHRHCDPFDQGDVGSCTGNAMAGACMTGPLFVPGRVLTEAEALKLYELATTLDAIKGTYPPDDTGSSGLAVCKAAQKAGYIKSYRHAFDMGAALDALSYTGPIIIGIPWFEGFDTPVGHNAEIKISGQIRGGHEVCVDAIDCPSSLVHITNSWGLGYGNKGGVVMSFSTFQRLLDMQGDARVPLK